MMLTTRFAKMASLTCVLSLSLWTVGCGPTDTATNGGTPDTATNGDAPDTAAPAADPGADAPEAGSDLGTDAGAHDDVEVPE